MDSITQAALGAMMGEVCLGRHWGRRAIVAGAIIGTLPDLDILAYPLLDAVDRLSWHRGVSHSILGTVLATCVLGYLIKRWIGDTVPAWQAYLMVFLVWSTHVLIDVFTSYGTQIFAPFSDLRVATHNFFIIDPLFTAPLVLALLVLIFWRREHAWRGRIAWTGTLLSLTYTLWSFIAQAWAAGIAEDALEEQGIDAKLQICSAAPLTTLYWYVLAEAPDQEDAWYYCYVALHDAPGELRWRRIERGSAVAAGVAETRAGQAATWFSQGTYEAWRVDDEVLIGDLRMGSRHLDVESLGDGHPSLFRFRIDPRDGSLQRDGPRRIEATLLLKHLWQRVTGAPP